MQRGKWQTGAKAEKKKRRVSTADGYRGMGSIRVRSLRKGEKEKGEGGSYQSKSKGRWKSQ